MDFTGPLFHRSGTLPLPGVRGQPRKTQTTVGKVTLDEAEAAAIRALRRAEEVLSETPIDGELADHGWSRSFALGIAKECADLRSHVEGRTYEASWRGAGLMRWMQDDVSPTSTDELKEAVSEAYSALRSLSEQLPPNHLD